MFPSVPIRLDSVPIRLVIRPGRWAMAPQVEWEGGNKVPFDLPARSLILVTYKTKLKLDKEVGGGNLGELCTITYLIAYTTLVRFRF